MGTAFDLLCTMPRCADTRNHPSSTYKEGRTSAAYDAPTVKLEVDGSFLVCAEEAYLQRMQRAVVYVDIAHFALDFR